MAQEKAISLAANGHSVLMPGSCGTEKSYTLRKIIQTLTNLKSVAVTATTGMASMQIGMNASTVHHWSGILDGRYSHEKLMDLYNNDKFASAKQRVACCECLIIDEISMLSRKTFETLEFVCRHLKQNNLCFGGIQVIRQKEKDLALAVQELCDGTPSSDTIHLLRSLQRPLNIADDRITRLYGTIFDVRFINEVMIDNLEGNTFVFKSNDQARSIEKYEVEKEVSTLRTNIASCMCETLVSKKRTILCIRIETVKFRHPQRFKNFKNSKNYYLYAFV